MNRNINAVGFVYDGTVISVTESLTQIEIEIVQTEYTWLLLFLDFAYSGGYPFSISGDIRSVPS